MQPVNQVDFNPGALLDRLDPRDYHWSEVGSTLAPFDWGNEPTAIRYSAIDEMRTAIGNPSFIVNAKEQNGSYSCGGQSWSYYGATLETIFTKSYEERSAKFIYAQTYVYGGGSSGRDNSNLVIKQGWGLESLTPSYEHGMSPGEYFMERSQDITDEARVQAKKSKAMAYANVDLDIDTLAQACKANHGVILGIVGSNNGTWMSRKPAPPKDGDKLWYHWLYAGEVGMYEGEKAVHVLNSWGKVAGDAGWQWLTESYLKKTLNSDPAHGNSSIFAAWTLLYNKDAPVNSTFTHHFGTNLVIGQQSEEVRALQIALTITGHFPASISPTGYYGNATAGAVYKFQVANGIFPTSRENVGPRTRGALNVLFDK